MMNKEQKKNYISEMETQFQNNEAVLVTHYQGLTMSQLDELRAQMREHTSEMEQKIIPRSLSCFL